jgi:hypothetical protein
MAMKGEVNPEELNAVDLDGLEDRYHLEVKNYRLHSIEAPRSLVIIRHLHSKR